MPALMNFSPRNFAASIPAALSRTENYPMKNGVLQAKEMPASLLFQDDIISDYLLFFSRTEHSSDALEFLIAFRELLRERERNIFACDEHHIRTLLVNLLMRHVQEGSDFPVTLPDKPNKVLRHWLDGFLKSGSTKEKLALPLPMEAMSQAVESCLRDLKADILPRFVKSSLGEELAKVHPAAVLASPSGHEDIIGHCKGSTERTACDFWVSAHRYAACIDMGTTAEELYTKFGPSLPLLEVPVEECKRIEENAKTSAVPPPIDIFLTAQTYATNLIYTDAYPKFVKSDAGRSFLKGTGLSGVSFDKEKMPPPPSGGGDAYGADW